jgi:RNA polymerase sigma-70 factor (ECF subfamily)
MMKLLEPFLAQDILKKLNGTLINNKTYNGSLTLLKDLIMFLKRQELDVLRSKHHRKTRITSSLDGQELIGCVNPFSHLDHIDISKLFLLLKPKDRNITELCFFRGYTCMETAEILQIPCGAAKTRMQNSYRKFKNVAD